MKVSTHFDSNVQHAKKTVDHIYKIYLKSINIKDCFTLVLSGGNTPKIIFDELVRDYTASIDWKKVHIFWLDERCVDPEHEDSNYKLAKDHLLDYLEPGSVHRMEGELEPKLAASRYEDVIRDFFDLHEGEIPAFDLILLGMGEDGHCASLFPQSSELHEKKRLVVSTEKQYNGHTRISLTLPVINMSTKVLMIGSQKKLDVFNDKQRALPIHQVNQENMKVIVAI